MPIEHLVITDVPRGKGFDPDLDGYQVAACSPGLTAEMRSVLSAICTHCGDAVRRGAPPHAKERETAWRRETDDRMVVPEEILQVFPVAWSYDRLADDRYALTRVCYSGSDQYGRAGNFLAHAVVFDPAGLAPYQCNPLTLTRSDLFYTKPPTGGTNLPALPDLGTPPSQAVSFDLLRAAPYSERLAQLISALGSARPTGRPVVVCLSDWRIAAAFVEALLLTIPAARRCRTTVCTLEVDRDPHWVQTAERATGPKAAHHLLVQCSEDDSIFALRPDEYQFTFAVFNFVGGRFSDLGEPRPFAAFAADCILNDRHDVLSAYHEMLAEFGLDQDEAAWDQILPAAVLLSGQASPGELTSAGQALVAAATQPPQVEAALKRLLRVIRSSVQAQDLDRLAAVAAPVGELLDRLTAQAGPDAVKDRLTELQALAGQAWSQGQGRITSTLLKAVGNARSRMLLALLTLIQEPSTASIVVVADAEGRLLPHVEDRKLFLSACPEAATDEQALLEILLDGLLLASSMPDDAPPLNLLLWITFRAAFDLDRSAEVWTKVGVSHVKPYLSGEWDQARERLALVLVSLVTADACPDANAWLNLTILRQTKPKDEKLVALLGEIAGCQSTDAAKNVAVILAALDEQAMTREARAIAVGRIAERARGDAREPLLRAYASHMEALSQTDTKRATHVRIKLAQAGVTEVLSRELLRDVLPWSQDSEHRFRQWRDVFSANPAVLATARQHAARCLAQEGPRDTVLLFAVELLESPPGKDASPELISLYDAIALSLPLAPIPGRLRKPLATPLAGMNSHAAARLRVLHFLGRIERRADDDERSILEFPHNDPAWVNDLRLLSSADKAAVISQSLATIETVGITTPEEAERLVSMLVAAGEKDTNTVADAVSQLLQDRDPVTHVLVATAFSRCALEGSRSPESWGLLVGAIVERFDRNTRRLFESHMARRFHRRGHRYEEDLNLLFDAARLTQPRPAAAPAKPNVGAPPAPTSDAGSIMSTAKRHLRRLFGGPADEPPGAGPAGRRGQ